MSNAALDTLKLELIREIMRVKSELRPVSAIIVNDYALKDVVKNMIGDLPEGMNEVVTEAKLLVNYNQQQSFSVASDY